MSDTKASVVRSLKWVAKLFAIVLASPFVLYGLWKLGTSVYTVFVPEYGAHCGKSVIIEDGETLGFQSDGLGNLDTPLLAAPGIIVVHSVRYRSCESFLTPEAHVGKSMFFELRIPDVQRVLDYWANKSVEQTKNGIYDSLYSPRKRDLEDLFYLVWPHSNENSVVDYIAWLPSRESLRTRMIVAYEGGALFQGDSPNQFFFIRP